MTHHIDLVFQLHSVIIIWASCPLPLLFSLSFYSTKLLTLLFQTEVKKPPFRQSSSEKLQFQAKIAPESFLPIWRHIFVFSEGWLPKRWCSPTKEKTEIWHRNLKEGHLNGDFLPSAWNYRIKQMQKMKLCEWIGVIQ